MGSESNSPLNQTTNSYYHPPNNCVTVKYVSAVANQGNNQIGLPKNWLPLDWIHFFSTYINNVGEKVILPQIIDDAEFYCWMVRNCYSSLTPYQYRTTIRRLVKSMGPGYCTTKLLPKYKDMLTNRMNEIGKKPWGFQTQIKQAGGREQLLLTAPLPKIILGSDSGVEYQGFILIFDNNTTWSGVVGNLSTFANDKQIKDHSVLNQSLGKDNFDNASIKQEGAHVAKETLDSEKVSKFHGSEDLLKAPEYKSYANGFKDRNQFNTMSYLNDENPNGNLGNGKPPLIQSQFQNVSHLKRPYDQINLVTVPSVSSNIVPSQPVEKFATFQHSSATDYRNTNEPEIEDPDEWIASFLHEEQQNDENDDDDDDEEDPPDLGELDQYSDLFTSIAQKISHIKLYPTEAIEREHQILSQFQNPEKVGFCVSNVHRHVDKVPFKYANSYAKELLGVDPSEVYYVVMSQDDLPYAQEVITSAGAGDIMELAQIRFNHYTNPEPIWVNLWIENLRFKNGDIYIWFIKLEHDKIRIRKKWHPQVQVPDKILNTLTKTV